MPKGSLRLIRCLPNAPSRSRVLAEGGPNAHSAISALSDRLGGAILYQAGASGAGEGVSFSELVGRSLDWCGLPRGHALATEREEAEAVALACRDVPPDSPFAASSGFPGLHRKMRRTLRELRQWGIGPDELRRLASSTKPHLAARLTSLAEIECQVRETLSRIGKTWLEERIERVLSARAEGEARPGRILLFAGSEASSIHLQWIRWAVEQGAAVTVAVDGHPRARDVFQRSRSIESELGSKPLQVCDANSLAINVFSEQPSMEADFGVEVFSASDPLSEVEWMLRRAQRMSADGLPWNALAVVCRDLNAYGPMLESAAMRLGVPLKMARRAPLITNGLCRAMTVASRAVVSSDPEALSALADSSYLGMTVLERGAWRSLASTLAARGPEAWRSITDDSSAAPCLAALKQWRETMPKAASLDEWVAWWRKLLDFEWVRAARQTPSESQARDDSAAGAFEDTLLAQAQVAGTTERAALTGNAFAELVLQTLRSDEYGVLASAKGLLIVGTADEVLQAQHLFVIGMLEGSFPRRRSEDPILGDHERAIINSLRPDSPGLPDSRVAAHCERDEFVKVCAAPSKGITFSYPQTDEDRDNVPAFYLEEVERAMGGEVVKTDHPRSAWTPDVDACLSEADRELAIALDSLPSVGPPNSLLLEASEAAIRPGSEAPFSPGELRDAVTCPFRYAFRRRLDLHQVADSDGWEIVASLLRRSGMPAFSSIAEAKARLEEMLDADLSSAGSELSASDLHLIRSGGRRLIRNWVEREFQARALWPKEPGSVQVPAEFGREGLRGEVPAKGRTIRLRGGVTALAEMGAYSVAQLLGVRRSLADAKKPEELTDADRMELGLYLLAQWGHKPGAAVEVESSSGQRTLYLLPRRPEQEIEARPSEGLKVVDLGEPREFFPQVKESLTLALERIESASVEPCPGDHCRFCEFGEICRSAQGYGEAEMGAMTEAPRED